MIKRVIELGMVTALVFLGTTADAMQFRRMGEQALRMIEDAKGNLSAERQRADNSERNLANTRAALANTRTALANAQTDLANAQTDLARLNTERDRLDRRVMQAFSTIARQYRRNQELDRENQELNRERQNQILQIADLNARLNGQNDQIRELNTRVAQLDELYDFAANAAQESDADARRLNIEKERFIEFNRGLVERIRQLSADVESLGGWLQDLLSHAKNQDDRIRDKDDRIRDQAIQILDQDANAQQNAQQNAQINALREQINAKQREIDTAKEEFERVIGALQNLDKKPALKRTNSSPIESYGMR